MGFLNPQGDDLSRIDAMPGTSEVPPAGALEGLGWAIPKGVAEGVDKVAQMGNALGATDVGSQVIGALTMQPAAFVKMAALEGQDIERNNAALKVVTDWAATGTDPRKTGVVGRIAAGTAEGISIGLAGGAVAGPWGAAALLGTTEGHASYSDAREQGVDETTALEQGAITGITSGIGAFLPLKYGKELWQTIAGGVGTNVALGAAQRGLTSKVLEDHGYHDMASQYRIFDGEAMAADVILGAAFGVMGHYSPHAAAAVKPSDVDAAAAVATESHFNRSAPGVPTDPAAATLHADTMADALRSLADGDLPDVPADRAQALVDNMVPDPAHDMAPAIHEAAQLELPGFEAAAADIKPIEMPPEEIPPPKPEPEPAPAGEPAKTPDVPLDDFHGSMLDHLVHNYGDETYVTEDGRELTYRQMANEMQARRNEADAFSKLHEVAAACALRNGQ